MKKVIYIIRGKKTESYDDFLNRIAGAMGRVIVDNPVKLKVVLTVEAPPILSVIPFKKTKIACVSVWWKKDVLPDELTLIEGFVGKYSVTEALPVIYDKSWPDLMMTPGVCLLTLFNRKKGITREVFLDRWHYSHTPLSLKIHPLWNYTRNVVEKELTANSEHFEGIVEEQFRTDGDLLNPFRFFGNPGIIIPRMLAVYRDTKSFIDYSGIETYRTMEIVVKS